MTDQATSNGARPYDVTEGDLIRGIVHLSVPNLLSQVLFMAPGLYDAIWLGRIGPGAQAAASLATSVRMTMISVLMALSGASGAVVARYIGAKDQVNANRAAAQAVLLMAAAAGVLGAIGFGFAEPLMRLAGADADVLPLAVRYARILFAGLIAMELVPSIGGMLSAGGAPGVTLTMNMWCMGIMLVAEPLLVRWLGLEGAVLAMVVAYAGGTLWGLGVLLRGRAPVRLDVHDLRPDFSMMRRILRISLPAILQRGIPNFAMSLLVRLVSGYGATTLAAWEVVKRIYSFAQIPGMGLSRVAPAMVGQNLGAGKPDRAERSVKVIARVVWVAMLVIGIALVLSAPVVMTWFSDDPSVINVGVRIMRLLAVGYLAFVINMVYDAAQVGAGDTVSPMVINLAALWLLQIPLAFLLPRWLKIGVDGIWYALVIGWVVQAGLMFRRYRQGHWKLKRI